MPKSELDICPDHWDSPFGLKLHETSSYVSLTRFASKKEHFQDFSPSTTSGIVHTIVDIHTYIISSCIHTSIMGRPRATPPPNRANKLPTQFKFPYTSSECKILNAITEPLTFAGYSAFWGAVWGPVRILHPL